jgi:hypothetical protein
MSDANRRRMTVSSGANVTVRQRPSLLLMKLQLHAEGATLELGLADLKRQCAEASQWLRRLGAGRVDAGDPHFADQSAEDPMKAMRAATFRAMGKQPAGAAPGGRRREVRAVLTAAWEIAPMPAEEVLVLVDRLRFEAAGVGEATEEPSPWATPEE